MENKILELANIVATKDLEKAKLEEALSLAKENIQKHEILINSEQLIKGSLELQLKESSNKIYDAEISKQQESDKRVLAEQKIAALLGEQQRLEQENANLIAQAKNNQQRLEQENTNKITNLINQQQHIEQELINKEHELKVYRNKLSELERTAQQERESKSSIEHKLNLALTAKQFLEQEKAQNDEKFTKIISKMKDLEIKLETEKQLRKEVERLKQIEEQARKLAQDKISKAITDANRSVLSALGGLNNPLIPNDDT